MRRQPCSLRVKSGFSRLQPEYSKANAQGSSGFLVPGHCPSCVHTPVRFSTLPVSCCLALEAEGFSSSFSISKSPPCLFLCSWLCTSALGAVLEVEDAVQVCCPQPALASTGLWDHTERAERMCQQWQMIAGLSPFLGGIYRGRLHPGLSCPVQSEQLCREGHLSLKQALLVLHGSNLGANWPKIHWKELIS